jgi:tRNA1(Val) A37 N6-methylase TrmN6
MADSSLAHSGSDITCDGFLDGRIKVCQPRKGPRTAIDALFLASAIPAQQGRGQRVLEAGTGSGVAALALAARIAHAHVTAVEIQPGLCDLARRNAELNAMAERIEVFEADVTAGAGAMRAAGLDAESFDHAAANPPYLDARTSRLSPDATIARAHALGDGELEGWIGFLFRMVRPKGTVTVIHRADALPELLALFGARSGGMIVFPLFPRENEPANRIIVQARKGSRAPLVLKRGLVIHAADGSYTREADAILRSAEALDLD